MKGEQRINPFQEPDLKIFFPAVFLALVALAGCRVDTSGSDDQAAGLHAEFDQLRSDYLADYWQHHPVQAASAGQMAFHDRLPAMTVADINHQIEQIQTSLNQLESLPVDQISDPTRQNEWYRLRSHARERLLNLDELKQWQRDPGLYVPVTAFEILLDPATGPAMERAGWLLARLHQLPILLDAGRENLNQPPQRFTLDAIQRADSLAQLIDQELPKLADGASEFGNELVMAGEMAASELRSFSRHLREQVLPDSIESAAIGRDLYQRYLVEVHQINFPPEAIITSARHEFADIEHELTLLAAEHGDETNWAEVLESLAQSPDPTDSEQIERGRRLTRLADEVLQSARIVLDARIHTGQISVDEARHFLSDHLHMAHDRTGREVRQLLDHPGSVFATGNRQLSTRLLAEVLDPISADERLEEY